MWVLLTSVFSISTQLVESTDRSLPDITHLMFPQSVSASSLQVLPSKSTSRSMPIVFSTDRKPDLPRLSVVSTAPDSGPSVTRTVPVPSISIENSPQDGSRIPPAESLTMPSISSPLMLTLESITWKSMLSPNLSFETVKPELLWRKTVAAAPTRIVTSRTATTAFHRSPREERVGIEMTSDG